jgi:hypothetical protein
MDMDKKSVKKQARYRGGGFDEHPENINKEGRPDNPWTWRELFLKIAAEKKGQQTRKEIAAEAQWKKMESGDTKAFEKIAERMEGKAPQPIGSLDEDGEFKEQNLTVRLVGDDD